MTETRGLDGMNIQAKQLIVRLVGGLPSRNFLLKGPDVLFAEVVCIESASFRLGFLYHTICVFVRVLHVFLFCAFSAVAPGCLTETSGNNS